MIRATNSPEALARKADLKAGAQRIAKLAPEVFIYRAQDSRRASLNRTILGHEIIDKAMVLHESKT